MRGSLWLLLSLLLVLGGCKPTTKQATTTTTAPSRDLPQAVKLQGSIFASEWKVTIIARDATTLHQARAQSIWINATLAEVERQLSLWKPESELSRFNRAEWTEAVSVTPGLGSVLATCLDVGAKTDGAFDITLGPLLELWGFSASTKGKVTAPPSVADIATARARTGLSLLHLDSGGLKKDREDVVVDVTAVGDAAAAAAVMAGLAERGFQDVLVDVAGEVVVRGSGLSGPWQVGVNVPTPDAAPDAVERIVLLPTSGAAVRALSTSGTYRESFSSDGQRYAHILDPRTAAPVPVDSKGGDLVSCTIVAADVVVADALSTACLVLGEEQTRAILDRFPGAQALFLRAQPDLSIAATTTAGFPAARP